MLKPRPMRPDCGTQNITSRTRLPQRKMGFLGPITFVTTAVAFEPNRFTRGWATSFGASPRALSTWKLTRGSGERLRASMRSFTRRRRATGLATGTGSAR
jgi:hypothetical protein